MPCIRHHLILIISLDSALTLADLQAMELPLPPSQSTLAKSLSPSIASKQPGNELFLSDLVAEASLAVMPKNPKDFSVDAVRVVKILGGSLSQSRVVRGMVFGREPDGESHEHHEGGLPERTGCEAERIARKSGWCGSGMES